jgi:F0F1-type ATP synthase membrane subunit b/b'
MVDANLIVLIGFSIFMALIFRFGYRKSLSTLDDKIEEIKMLLDTAELAHLQSKQQVEREKQQATLISEEVAAMKKSTEQQIAEIEEKAANELDRILKMKSDNARLVLDRLRTQAVHHLKQEVTDAALALIKTIAQHELKVPELEKLNQHYLEMLDQIPPQGEEKVLKKKLTLVESSSAKASNF